MGLMKRNGVESGEKMEEAMVRMEETKGNGKKASEVTKERQNFVRRRNSAQLSSAQPGQGSNQQDAQEQEQEQEQQVQEQGMGERVGHGLDSPPSHDQTTGQG